MSTTKFKVGDKVRIKPNLKVTENHFIMEGMLVYRGHICTISKIFLNYSKPYFRLKSNDCDEWLSYCTWDEDSFDLVEKKQEELA